MCCVNVYCDGKKISNLKKWLLMMILCNLQEKKITVSAEFHIF